MHKHPLVLNGFLRLLNSSLGMIMHDNNYSTSFFERLCIWGEYYKLKCKYYPCSTYRGGEDRAPIYAGYEEKEEKS
jgi:hypothetical protein